MCMIDYGEGADVYVARVRKARKPHKCDECGRIVNAGEQYLYASMLYERHWSSFATCEHCQSASQWLSDNCGGYLHGGVLEDIQEHRHEYPQLRFSLLRLEIGMCRQWKRFDGAGLMAVQAVPQTLAERGLE